HDCCVRISAIEDEAWPVKRIGEVDAVHHVAGEDLCLDQRLRVAAHCSVYHHATIGETGKRRMEGVERPYPRPGRIGMARLEGEGAAAVLPHDAGARQHKTGSEGPEHRLYEGDREPVAVDRCHIDRVTSLD